MDCESNPVKVQDGSSQGSHEESSCCEASVLNIVVSLNKIQMCCWDRKENHPSTVVMKGKLAFWSLPREAIRGTGVLSTLCWLYFLAPEVAA